MAMILIVWIKRLARPSQGLPAAQPALLRKENLTTCNSHPDPMDLCDPFRITPLTEWHHSHIPPNPNFLTIHRRILFSIVHNYVQSKWTGLLMHYLWPMQMTGRLAEAKCGGPITAVCETIITVTVKQSVKLHYTAVLYPTAATPLFKQCLHMRIRKVARPNMRSRMNASRRKYSPQVSVKNRLT